ncbi:hypothetical protein SAMN05216188_13081 [Lentzea xinjiangensis]|uniref:Uncharacterized protein n=1 Tax=Lentzea xinjiangensis TaxID=402600 RepID=A0A1H9W550_9PSEU|nr:hypothetical protein [Lentzea xinjiangensis]SES28891.1 hypothetical protein SAMN05216188_13081 [Lentzea xinjiangensis]
MSEQDPEPSTVVWRELPNWHARSMAAGFQALRDLFGGEPSERARAVVQRELYREQVEIPPRAAG